jgi:hypothetical protein
MRKQDRIRQQQSQNPSERQPEKPQPRPTDQVKSGASSDQPNKPPRESGKLPLPD